MTNPNESSLTRIALRLELSSSEGIQASEGSICAVHLGILTFAFFLRVLGQFLVVFFQADWLPPLAEWSSGLLAYPLLLSIQLLILVVQAKVFLDIWRNTGFFAIRRPRTGKVLCWISTLYFAVMVLRFVQTMSIYPEQSWFTGLIPIFFHWVLAAYLFVLGGYQVRTDEGDSTEKQRRGVRENDRTR
jgi:hypothetical protein